MIQGESQSKFTNHPKANCTGLPLSRSDPGEQVLDRAGVGVQAIQSRRIGDFNDGQVLCKEVSP